MPVLMTPNRPLSARSSIGSANALPLKPFAPRTGPSFFGRTGTPAKRFSRLCAAQWPLGCFFCRASGSSRVSAPRPQAACDGYSVKMMPGHPRSHLRRRLQDPQHPPDTIRFGKGFVAVDDDDVLTAIARSTLRTTLAISRRRRPGHSSKRLPLRQVFPCFLRLQAKSMAALLGEARP